MTNKEKKTPESNRTIYRVEKNNNYSVINNTSLKDKTLSWGAKGLLAHMLTMPDDWKFYNEALAEYSPESIKMVKKYIKELKDKGYIRRVQVRDEQTNKILRWETVVYEVPLQPEPVEEPKPEEKPKEEIPELPAEPPEDKRKNVGKSPQVPHGTSGENVDFTPEVPNPPSGIPGGLENHSVEKVQLLSTDITLSTEEQIIPIRGDKLPEIQQATAMLFTSLGRKEELSPDDRACLNMLFKIHTPAAVNKEIIKAFERLEKNKQVTVRWTDEKDYLITADKKDRLPMRYIWNSMKNWSSLKAVKGGRKDGKASVNRGNPNRTKKNYAGSEQDLFAN